jgi:hypothetical protein
MYFGLRRCKRKTKTIGNHRRWGYDVPAGLVAGRRVQ